MRHALIIDDNMIVSRAIEKRLGSLGFASFDHAWTEKQALAAAAQCLPDLIVIGDGIETGSPLNAARQIAEVTGTPVLMVTGDSFRAREQLRQLSAFAGPFLLNEIETAVELALTNPPETMSPAMHP